ncbi:MAG TPA: prolyl oligopeptidase family serine peptidase, partial [Candidatus Acidoferrum sp.]|nr:prolyl oligopeptidase family serine peptidase [Candidatus Acidoferrum sp.]
VIHGGNGIELPAAPATEAKPVTEEIHGKRITDPYRWLEDGQSPETRAWIAAQMKYTESYLSQVRIRPEIAKRVTELVRAESYSIPVERQGKYFFTKRLPEENQASIYMRRGLHGSEERLVDAAKLSADQNTSVHINDVSKDGDLLVYGVREGGADEQVVRLLDVKAKQALPDVLPRGRYSQINIGPGKQGLYYGRLETTGTEIYYHRLGMPVESDQVIFGKEFNGEKLGPMQLIGAGVTENERYLLIEVEHGVPATRADVYVKDLRTPDAPIRAIIHGIDNRFQVENHGDDLYALTDYQAENYRVLRIHISDPSPEKWQTVAPESKDVISEISIVGGKLFVTGLHDVVTQTQIYSLDGKVLGKLEYPTLGSASAVYGLDGSDNGFYTFQSFIHPPTIYHYDVKTGKAEIFAKPQVPFVSEQYEVKQVFYTSKDGTRLPMFISSKKGVKTDGSAPTLLSAYGGFNISMTATWSPEFAWWMEQGGFFAQPNLRGGGEYGENWHKAGMFEKKQNVFDDFFAAAEFLIAHKYTSTARLAIRGRSNGGLLMGAAMTQRPDLFGAIWCGFPLLDMLRYQNFLVGRWWTTEYGSAENPEQFRYLLKYSPYQNVKAGTKYPAVMFHTGDSDTRVAPLHARKMTALLQADNASGRPVLLHYELKAGHSAGVSITQLVDDTADELAFLWNESGGK